MIYLVILYTAITSGWSGGSLPGHKLFGRLDFMPEVLFSLAFVVPWYSVIGIYSLLIAPWCYIWMQTGHANALPWGSGGHNPDRENTLSPVVKTISDKLGIEYYSINYARLFMAVKGFLLTLPAFGFGIILWPLGYEIGHRAGHHVVSEVLSGAGAGLSIVATYLILHQLIL